jgi:hypothetical protein
MWAMEFVRSHYGVTDDYLSPAVLNHGWESHMGSRRTRALQGRQPQGPPLVTMPDWFRAALSDAFGATRQGDVDVQAVFDSAKAMAGVSEDGHGGIDAHCGWLDCSCAHLDGCYRGWLTANDTYAVPCRRCRPALADVLAVIPGPGERSPRDLNYLRDREVRESGVI